MFCKDCGAQLTDDVRFCPQCGCTQPVTVPAETVISPAEPEQSFADKVRSTAKKVGSSSGFLIATICFTLVQLLGLFSLFSTGSILASYTDILVLFGGFGQAFFAYSETMSLAMGILFLIPSFFVAIALWNIYGSCASRKDRINTSGLTLIFVIKLVQLVLSCLALLAISIPTAALILRSGQQYNINADSLKKFMSVLGLIFLAIFLFVLIYNIKICTTISNVRSTLKTGVPNRRASCFVAFILYLWGGIRILTGTICLLHAIIASLQSFYEYNQFFNSSYIPAFTALLTAAAMIIFGALIFSYHRKMKALEAEERLSAFQTLSSAAPYTSPVYIPPEPVEEPEVTAESEQEELPEPQPTSATEENLN